jgi:RES domain-containing protein
VLVPSFARGAGPRDVNAVFWRWSPRPPHQVQVVDDHGRLPRDAASWPAV